MKKQTSKTASASSRKRGAARELAREYRFDYSKSKKNRFARRLGQDVSVVLLDPDVAAVISDSKRVNALLRATIAALAEQRPRRAG